MNKKILYGLILLLTLSLTFGAVSASDNFANETYQVNLDTTNLEVNTQDSVYESGFILDDSAISQNSDEIVNDSTDISQITNNVYLIDAPSISSNEINFANIPDENLLGLSIEENVILKEGNVITFDGNYFSDVRNAISQAGDGDIIDLEGKEIIALPGGTPVIQTSKRLTFRNGVFNAGNVSAITINNRNFIENCNFEDITFKNYNDVCMYPNFFINCNLNHVSFENFSLAVAGFVFRNSNLYDVNFTNCHSHEPEDENDYEYAAMAVTYNSVLDHCNFVNCTTNRHSGAICVAGQYGNRVDILNSNFINCSAGIGGAIYVHGNGAINENYHSNIINCTFIGNTATERGGAIGSSQNYLVVENCIFENNTAKQGAAYMLAGIDHGLDGITEGHYNTMINCTFRNNTGTEEGGAIHITGNNNRAINCTFWDNYATDGNGSAIYVHGQNSSIINSEFYEHECSRGTVYIIGDNTVIENSTFENNTALKGGAAIYVVGDNTFVDNSLFNKNSAVIHGGAIHSHGDNLTITNSNFTSNHAIASSDDLNQGLGGAIYIEGNNSNISYSYFENNVARNGSAIYNRGQNLTIEDDTFIENQAWSYLITGVTNDKRFYYNPEGVIIINVTHRGGDNIINAIYNDGSPNYIFFQNVTYESSVNDKHNTGSNIINPVDGVDKSENGTLIYQDPREDLQNITIVVTHLETGQVVINFTSKTGIYGNASVSEKGLLPGNYSVNVTHFEDGLYKFITNMTYFEILPVADLAIEKTVSNKTPNFADEITWTIKVTNKGPNNVSDAYVIDKLPAGLIFNGADGNYNETTGRWEIGTLNVNDTKILNIKTIVNITNTTILNVASVNSSTYDPNETNNIANNTTKSNTLTDLSVVKLVSQKTSVIGDTIVWTIKVTNNGPDIAVNAYAIDVLPSGISYVSDDSNGKYNSTTGRWEIGDLNKGSSAVLNIKTKINVDNTTIVNNVFVNSSTPDSNMSNNNASNDTVILESNFIVEKNTITPIVSIGEQVKFQIVVKNTGLTNLTNVFVEEFSYDGLIFDQALNQSHWIHSIVNGKNRWTLKDKLSIGQVTILTVLFNTTRAGNFTNVVVAGSDETDNKTASNDTTVVKPELEVEKITITPMVILGEQVIFEIIVKNTCLVNLTNVFVEEFSYEGLVFDHANTEGFWVESFVDGKTRWTYEFEIAPGVTHGFTVVFNTTVVGNFTNVVVAGSENAENKTTNNTTVVVKPEFTVEKISLNPLVSVGEQVTFEIIVRNTGITDLTNVIVNELKYDGLIFDHAYGLGHWKEIDNNSWMFNNKFSAGESHGFFVVFNTTVAGNFTNVVVVKSDYTENKTAENNTTAVNPEFSVEKICLNPLVSVGEQVTFEIIVRNTGVVDLTNVVVSENVPDGLIFDHAYGLGHWKAIGNYSWTFENKFSVGESHGFFVVFNTTGEGNFTNVVVVKANYTENKTAENNTTVVKPMFTVEKISLDPIVPLNNLTRFQIVVRNVGQTELTGVFIEETDYEELTYVTFIDTEEWYYDFNTVTPGWKLIKSLNPNQVATLTVIFNATKLGNWTNTVTVGADKADNKTANNTTEVYEEPPIDPEQNATNPNLTVEKIALEKIVLSGNQVTFEIVVRNTGDKRLHDVTVYEKFDDALEFDHIIDNTELWIKNNDLSFKYNATLYKGETTKFYVVFNTNKTGEFTNVVIVTSNETENKTANDSVEVVEPVLVVGKVAINKTVVVGNQVIFEIVVGNSGRVALNGVVVDELSFDGLDYAGWFDDTGLWSKNGDLTWSLGSSLAPGEFVGFFVVFNTTDVGNFTNVVVVSSDEVPNKTANDSVKVLKPDFSVEKLTVNKIIHLGEIAYFEIIIRNTGEVTLTNLTVYETDFEGLIYAGWFDDTGLWSKNDDLSWTFNSYLSPGVYTGFFVSFNTTKTGHFINVVNVTNDLVPNKTANDTVDVVKPEFSVEKITLNHTVVAGEQVIFEIIIDNYGNVDLTNITVYEKEFEGLIYDSWFDYTGKWIKNNDLSWTYNSTLESKKYADFFVVFNTTEIGNFTNVVVVNSDHCENKSANNTTYVVGADLSAVKLVSNKTPIYGDEIIWTVIVTNNGPGKAKDAYVTDKLPNGLVYISDDSNGKYNATSGIWTIGDLAYNETAVLKIKTLVNISNVTVLNVAVVNSSTKDPNEENNIANNTTNPRTPGLNVTKTTLTPVVHAGDQAVFEIVVTNVGDCDLDGVFVEEKSFDELIYDSFNGVNWIKNNNKFIYNGILASGESVNFTVTFNTTKSGNFTNVVVAGSDDCENKTSNDTVEVLKPELSVEKLALTKIITLNGIITFEITVHNTGETDLTDVKVSEIVPEGLTYVGYHNTSHWTYLDDYSWSYNGVLTKGSYATLFIEFNATSLGNWTNVVVVSSDKTENKTSNDTVEVLNPGLDVVKIALNPIVVAGDEITFEIIVHNTGKVDLTNVVVEDIAPAELIYKDYKGNGLWIYEKGLWTLNGVLTPNEYAAFYVTFTTTSEGNFTNTVVASSNETGKIENNTTVSVIKGQLEVEKITLTPYRVVGEQVIFEIIVHNVGSIDLNDVYVVEDSYEGLVYDHFINNGDWTYSNNKWVLNHALKVGEYSALLVYFNTTKVGNFTNYVFAGSNESDVVYSNNTTQVFNKSEDEPVYNDTEVRSFDLIKTTINPVIILGEQAIFQIVIHNTGNVALNVTISEIFDEGLIYDSFVDYTGLFAKNADLSWNVTGLYPGEYAGFTVYFNTTRTGNFTNMVSAEEKTSNDTVLVLKPSYVIEKIALNKNLRIGDNAVFEIVVHNDGEVALDNIVIKELSFDGLIYDYFTDYIGAWDYDNLTWTYTTALSPGEYAGFFVVFNTTCAGEFTNVIVSGNKTSNDTVKVFEPLSEIEKIALNKTVYVGQQVIFEIIVHNTGLIDINDLTVEETSYDGLIYDHFIDEDGMWINEALTWKLNATLMPGEYSTFYVVFNTTAAGNFTNVIMSANNSANDSVEVNSIADLSIIKKVSNSNPNFGDVITWTIVVTNNGPGTAEDVYVFDNLEKGLVYQSSKATKGRFNSTECIWYIGDLKNGESVQLELSTLVAISNSSILNVANVNSSTYDPNPDNNNANNTTHVNPVADLSVEKVVVAIEGEYVTWAINVTNLGPDSAINTRAVDVLPNTLILVSYAMTKGSFDFNTGVWTIGDLANGESAVLIIKTIANATGTLINEVNVVSDTYDPNMNNNYDFDSVIVEEVVPDVEPPVSTPKSVDVTPATGNPLIMVLLALIALAAGTLRRKN